MCKSFPQVVVIILNWNNVTDTIKCIQSVILSSHENYCVLVVDNGSTDNSVSMIRNKYPSVEILETHHNLGYSEGNNVGIRHAINLGAQYVFILNNDVLVDRDTLKYLVSAGDQIPGAAFLGPKILHMDKPNIIQSMGGRLDFHWRAHHKGEDIQDGNYQDNNVNIDFLTGSAILGRVESLNKIGLLDPDYFLYNEDVDWCLRARRKGYQLVFVPEAKVWHRSHHIREKDLPYITYYMTRNSLWLIKKNKGGIFRTSTLLIRYMVTALSWMIRPKWRSKRTQKDALLRGITDFFLGKVGKM